MTQSKHRMTSLAGLVLCGGESKRMGTDKGLILNQGMPWFKRVGAIILQFELPVYYSINSEQLAAYSRYSSVESFIIDDSISQGPLRGVVSAMNATTFESLLVIACDMQDLQPALIASLLEAYQNSAFEFYAFRDHAFYQPFPGIYTRDGLLKQPAAKSLQQLLQSGNSMGLQQASDSSFPNYNQLP